MILMISILTLKTTEIVDPFGHLIFWQAPSHSELLPKAVKLDSVTPIN